MKDISLDTPAVGPAAAPARALGAEQAVAVAPSTALVVVPAVAAKKAGGLVSHWRWLLLIVPLLAGALYFGTPLVLGPRILAIAVIRGTLLRSVVATGRVLTPYRVTIGSEITGTVARVAVEEGQTVAAGQVLVVLEDRDEKGALDQAQGVLDQSQTKLQRLVDVTAPMALQALRQAEATLLNTQNSFARTSTLAADGFATRAALDDARHARDMAQAALVSARVQSTSGSPGGNDVLLAESDRDQARAALDSARAKLAHTVIAAPVAGTLIARNVEHGDVVQPQQALMTLSPAAPPQLLLQVDERNLALLAVGQTALGSADAYAAQNFPVVVSYINPSVDPARASVAVKLDVPNLPPYLREDMTVSVDITVARRPNVLILPLAAIHDPAGKAPWVLRAEAGRARRVPVQLGVIGSEAAEVTGGLAEHDIVLPNNTPPGAAVRDGDRVRARIS